MSQLASGRGSLIFIDDVSHDQKLFVCQFTEKCIQNILPNITKDFIKGERSGRF